MAVSNLPLLLLATSVASSAASLPLSPGTYVMANVPCDDPPLAALFTYDGSQFAYPHATDCRSVIRSRLGGLYRVETRCSALGDGTPASPTTSHATYEIKSLTRVEVRHGSEPKASAFRLCARMPERMGAPRRD